MIRLFPLVLGVMISNAADQERQGLTQGACGSVAALVRSFGPIGNAIFFCCFRFLLCEKAPVS
jgi:hypothetical protein